MLDTIKLNRVHHSFIWSVTVPTLLNESLQGTVPQRPLLTLGQRSAYEALFDAANHTPEGSSGITPPYEGADGAQPAQWPYSLTSPWRDSTNHKFWEYYLGTPNYRSKTGYDAWQALVPLRAGKIGVKLETPSLPGGLSTDIYFYPSGFSLVITKYSGEKRSLRESVRRAYQLRREGCFNLTVDEQEPLTQITLEDTARQIMHHVYRKAFGELRDDDLWAPTPFSVFSVIRGEGVTSSEPVGPDIFNALFAIIHKRAEPSAGSNDEPSNLQPTRIKTGNGRKGDVLYGYKKNRVVWFPREFVTPTGKGAALRCYHENLVLTSMHIQSLSQLVSFAANEIREHDLDLHSLPALQNCVKHAVKILTQLYYGDESTYQTYSAREQIRQNDLDDINYILTSIGDDELLPEKDESLPAQD